MPTIIRPLLQQRLFRILRLFPYPILRQGTRLGPFSIVQAIQLRRRLPKPLIRPGPIPEETTWAALATATCTAPIPRRPGQPQATRRRPMGPEKVFLLSASIRVSIIPRTKPPERQEFYIAGWR